MTKTKWRKVTGEATVKETKDACMEHWQLIVTSLLSNKDPKGQIHIWCADDLTAAFKILMC